MYSPSTSDDLDTTSIGLTVDTRVDPETKQRVMNEMLSYRNKDGIVQVYFDRKRPRIGTFKLHTLSSLWD